MSKKPDYWELFYNIRNELCLHLCDGNNHQILLQGEGYRNVQACLKVLYEREKFEEVDYYRPGSERPITCNVNISHTITKQKYYLSDFTTQETIKITSPSKPKTK